MLEQIVVCAIYSLLGKIRCLTIVLTNNESIPVSITPKEHVNAKGKALCDK
jgi:hypothetical protein